MDGPTIACRYLRFWFWLDSVAIFPWQLLAGTGDAGHTAVLVRNLRLVRRGGPPPPRTGAPRTIR